MRTRKLRLKLAIAALAFLPLLVCRAESQSPMPVKVGLLGNLTGTNAASFGIPFKNAFELALADIAAAGVLSDAKRSIELQTQNAATDITKAVTFFNQFASQKIPLVISDSSSAIGQAIAPLANDAKTAFLTGGGAAVENKAGFAFRFVDLQTPAGTVGRYLVEKGAKRVGAVVASNFPSFPELANVTLADSPLKYVTTQNVTTKDSDFSAVITNLKEANIDAVVLAMLPEQIGNIIQQMSNSGNLKGVTLTGTMSVSVETYTIAQQAAASLVFPQQWAPGSERSAAFEKAYKEKYKSVPTATASLGYQLAWVVAAAIIDISKSGKDVTGETLRDALPAASTSDLVKKRGILDLALLPSGAARSPGTLAMFGANGEIVEKK